MRILRSLLPLMFLILLGTMANQSFAMPLPSGTYLQTCQACSVFNNTLTCTCRTGRHSAQVSSLGDVNACPYVQNLNGHLRCLPKGNYWKTCRSCTMRGDKLFCECRTTNNYWTRTELRGAYSCRKIVNDNGVLRCHRRHRHFSLRGNYRQTCRRCSFNGNRLKCHCKRMNGSWHKTKLYSAANCPFIVNANGRLRCR